jgi:hypothetical protein
MRVKSVSLVGLKYYLRLFDSQIFAKVTHGLSFKYPISNEVTIFVHPPTIEITPISSKK